MVVESVGLGFKASGLGLGVQRVPVACHLINPHISGDNQGVARACQLES